MVKDHVLSILYPQLLAWCLAVKGGKTPKQRLEKLEVLAGISEY